MYNVLIRKKSDTAALVSGRRSKNNGPAALSRVKDITAKYMYFGDNIVEKFKEFVFDCNQPDQMQKMAQLIDAHIADPTSLHIK